jgi:hypothetical protein
MITSFEFHHTCTPTDICQATTKTGAGRCCEALVVGMTQEYQLSTPAQHYRLPRFAINYACCAIRVRPPATLRDATPSANSTPPPHATSHCLRHRHFCVKRKLHMHTNKTDKQGQHEASEQAMTVQGRCPDATSVQHNTRA